MKYEEKKKENWELILVIKNCAYKMYLNIKPTCREL